jgi:hypothetical protein
LLRKLCLVLLGTLAGLVIAEIAIRLSPLAKPQFFTYDSERGWSLKPNAHGWQRKEGVAYMQVNSAGLHDREHPLAKPPGTFRIAVVGDSYTEARQVAQSQNYSSVMEKELASCATLKGRRAEVINFGVDSYSTAQELITLRDHVWQYHPDLVILEVFVGNDLKENSPDLKRDDCRPFPAVIGANFQISGPLTDSSLVRLECWARYESRHLQVLNVLNEARRTLSRIETRASVAAAPSKGREIGLSEEVYMPPTDRAWRDSWAATEAAITEFATEVKRHQVPFLVVLPSIGIQVYPNPKARRRYMKRLGVTTLFYPDERIDALGRSHGFEVLDLSQPLQSYAEKCNCFLHGFKNSELGFGHWNENGHRIAGELIAARVCKLLAGPFGAQNGKQAMTNPN